jgi:hypothetical protein
MELHDRPILVLSAALLLMQFVIAGIIGGNDTALAVFVLRLLSWLVSGVVGFVAALTWYIRRVNRLGITTAASIGCFCMQGVLTLSTTLDRESVVILSALSIVCVMAMVVVSTVATCR